MNIVFLDDNTERLANAEKFIYDNIDRKEDDVIYLVETANQAIEILKTKKPYVVFLDHDLGGEVYVDSGREDCGMEVVRWMVSNIEVEKQAVINKQPYTHAIVVHSWNTVAGQEMVNKLIDVGHDAYYIPFKV